MAGIYLHIPFCRKACSYCDFHFSTALGKMDAMADCLQQEAALRAGFFADGTVIETIYFGGGTPSLLPDKALGQIMDGLRDHYLVSPTAEITLEANPDDLSLTKLRELKAMGVNRLSIGIQSFSDQDLLLLNRSHDAQQADRAVKSAQDLGITNITVDLIYGIPGSGRETWEANVAQVVALNVPHISAYALTVEEKTLLHQQIAKGWVTPEPDSAHVDQYFYLIDRLGEAGILQYELSNFARAGHRSQHNAAYWSGRPYLGLGPSAHSYNDARRSWNVANNAAYTRALSQGRLAVESEENLSDRDQLNEYLMTQLRTVAGLDLSLVKSKWGIDLLEQEEQQIEAWIAAGQMVHEKEKLSLTKHGFMVSDSIIRDLFQLEEE